MRKDKNPANFAPPEAAILEEITGFRIATGVGGGEKKGKGK